MADLWDIKIFKDGEHYNIDILGGEMPPKVYAMVLDYLTYYRAKVIGETMANLYEEDYFKGIEKDIGADYDEFSKGFAEEHKEVRIKYFNLKKDDRILEIGCAYGHLVDLLRKEGYLADGIDISKYAIGKYPEKYKTVMDLSTFYILDQIEPYSLIYSFAMMEHIEQVDLRQLIKNIRTMLKPNGIFFATIDNRYWADVTHKCIKPRKWWDRLFQSEGFCIDGEATEHFKNINGYVYRRVR